jgi:E1A/CREB-binding protein
VAPPLVTKGQGSATEIRKRDLRKNRYDEEFAEPWVQCDYCEVWVHQICSLFNLRKNAAMKDPEHQLYMCPFCLLKDKVPSPAQIEGQKLAIAPGADANVKLPKSEIECEECSPPGKGAKNNSDAASHINLYKQALSAEALPTTPMSIFLEDRAKEKLRSIGEDEAAETVVIRVVSCMDRSVVVHPLVRKHYGDSQKREYPEELGFRSKAIYLFQKIDGIDVCLFSMYVQEYGADSPNPNDRTVYIAYLDSVGYFRPRSARTAVYHEILASYLDFARQSGFCSTHIWACPPTRGNSFIFWCHPHHQRNPGRERLCSW